MLAIVLVSVSLTTAARRAILQHTAAAAVAAAAAPHRAAAVAYRSEPFSTVAAPGRTKAKCRDLESCQAEGERRAAEAEAKAGPLRRVGPPGADGLGRVRYRAMTEAADGPALRQGDAADVQFFVASTGGDYMFGVPSREPGVAATAGVLDSYRLVLGARDVPQGVEIAPNCADTCAHVPGPPYGTYGIRVPASRVLYVPGAQGSLPLPLLCVRGTRTSLGRAVRTAHRGTPGPPFGVITGVPTGPEWARYAGYHSG